jgi:tRNA-splicing ligase RtcB (3'-phosphate/5'-hydroxy nucleic acid ligase)
MTIIDGIPTWGEPLQNAVDQMKNCLWTAKRAALMADHHLGYAVPVGGVVAYDGQVSPSGVGFDIACGNKAVLTDATLADVRSHISSIMDDVWECVSFGVGRKNSERVDHELFEDPAWGIPLAASLKDRGELKKRKFAHVSACSGRSCGSATVVSISAACVFVDCEPSKVSEIPCTGDL